MSPQQFSVPEAGADVDAVLGVALTPSAVGMVLVEGSLAEGATLDHDSFPTDPESWASALGIAQQVSDAVARTCAISAAHGYHVRSVGVTWTDDADGAATALLNSLTATTSNRVVAVALRHAGEALLTWRTRSGVDSGPSAFCVLSGDTAMVVRVDDQKHLWHESIDASVDSSKAVVQCLDRRDRRPKVLYVVGSADDTAPLTSAAEGVLGARVSAPTEALLALARGAALVAARDGKNLGTASRDEWFSGFRHRPHPPRTRKWALAVTVAAVIAGAAWSIFAVDPWHSAPDEAVPDPPSVTPTRVTRVAVPAAVAPTNPTTAATAVDHLPPSAGSAPVNPGPGN
jgi:hypothetical protein